MINIAILVPVCSRGQNYNNLSSVPFINYLYPSFIRHRENYNYTFYIGYDSTDEFYKNNINKLSEICKDIDINIIELNNCEHKPAKAWNILFKTAIEDCDYFYQIGDDVDIQDNWTSVFVDLLKGNNNIGVVGACHLDNYRQRINAGKPAVIENAFVHKTHYQIFGTFFDERIDNWFCDNWITEIYKPKYSIHNVELFVKNMVVDGRYNIANIQGDIKRYIEEGKKILDNGLHN